MIKVMAILVVGCSVGCANMPAHPALSPAIDPSTQADSGCLQWSDEGVDIEDKVFSASFSESNTSTTVFFFRNTSTITQVVSDVDWKGTKGVCFVPEPQRIFLSDPVADASLTPEGRGELLVSMRGKLMRYMHLLFKRRASISSADQMFDACRYAEALKIYAQVKASPPSTYSEQQVRVASRIAECQYALGRYAEALVSFDDLLAKFPHGARKYAPDLHRADCLAILGKTNEAIRSYAFVNKNYSTNYHVDVEVRMEAMRNNRLAQTPPPGRVVKVQCYRGNGPGVNDPNYRDYLSDKPREGRDFSVDVQLEEFSQSLSPAEFLVAVVERFKSKHDSIRVDAVGVTRFDHVTQKYVSVEHRWGIDSKSGLSDRTFLGRMKDGDIVIFHGCQF